MSVAKAEVTSLLQRWQAGDRQAEDELWPIVYRELEVLAAAALRSGNRSPSLQTTELLNEACVRLIGGADRSWPSRGHFFAFAAKVMRRVLIDHARKRRAAKRQGEIVESPPQIAASGSDRGFDLLGIDRALDRLAELSPRNARLVELRFFGGLSVDEAAEALGISKATAVRDWRAARAWLYGQLRSAVE